MNNEGYFALQGDEACIFFVFLYLIEFLFQDCVTLNFNTDVLLAFVRSENGKGGGGGGRRKDIMIRICVWQVGGVNQNFILLRHGS